ncbi:helix-turn-helix domain-containing protein [Sedimentitalea nanhaiensis]|uniref:Helix-turn-helix n=1 Tax=Sedimentitalea nanhaiensis TaxID=999627 RepID=A0A1I7CL78_9RHOB|nr:helix-turn-helix transcriptional regulator [Sedimentitalea nanhaiensis]SFU00168.1 Helix-turn-helix [Sedimentitalea nanhaiensis]
MNAEQLRMARAALKWSVRDLAEKSGITANTISRIENGSDTRTSTVACLKRTLEDGGVVFIPENGGGAGVRLARS